MKVPHDFSYAFHTITTPTHKGRPLQCVMIGCHGLATVQVRPSEGAIRYLCGSCAKVVARFPKQAEFVYLMTHSGTKHPIEKVPGVRKISKKQEDFMRAPILPRDDYYFTAEDNIERERWS